MLGDADWAVFSRARRSTSGGAIRTGDATTKVWSKTQAVVAKSRGESDFYGVVRASCEALGAQTLMNDFGVDMMACVHVGASTAKAICETTGLDKLRHLDVNHLWPQEQHARDRALLATTHGRINAAEWTTKHLSFQGRHAHLEMLGIEFREGRADKAAQLYSTGNGDGRGREDACSPPPPEPPGEGGCNGGKGRGMAADDNGNTATADNPGTCNCTWDRWIMRGGNKVWIREPKDMRVGLFTPLGAIR